MKKIISFLLMALMVFSLAACAGNDNNSGSGQRNNATENKENTEQKEDTEDGLNNSSNTENVDNTNETPADAQTESGKKVLVAYFSATGTTKKLAEYAADAMDADLYEIVPQKSYTDDDLDYGDKNSRSTKEMDAPSSRPKIDGSVEGMDGYEIVFIGYPIWWGEAPRIISTFMESYDFSGKTIVPFCTSGGSGLGSSAKNLHSLTSDSAKWLDGDRLSSGSSRADIVEWINGLGLELNAK